MCIRTIDKHRKPYFTVNLTLTKTYYDRSFDRSIVLYKSRFIRAHLLASIGKISTFSAYHGERLQMNRVPMRFLEQGAKVNYR